MKSLVENSIFNIIYRCSNLLFPLIISTYASRMLFADGIGKVASAQNVVTYFTTLAALGLPTYGIKAVAILGKTKESRSKVFSELFCINAFSTLISSVLYCILLLIVPYFRYRLEISIVCGLAILFNFVNVDWFYQGCEEYGYIMIRNIIVKIISLVSVFLFVHAPSDYIIYALVLTLSRCLNNIFNIFHLRKYVRFTLKNLDFHKHLKPVLVLFASSLAKSII